MALILLNSGPTEFSPNLPVQVQNILPHAKVVDAQAAGGLVETDDCDASVMIFDFGFNDIGPEDLASKALAWPNALAALGEARGHAMIHAAPKVDSRTGRIAAARLAVQITSCLAATEGAIGVFSPEVGSLMEAARFAAIGAAIEKGIWPVEAVLGLVLFHGTLPDGTQTVAATTTNATPLLGVEIHTGLDPDLSPAEHCQTLMTAGSYLLETGALLQSGDTIGAEGGPYYEARAHVPDSTGAPVGMELVRMS